MSRSHTTVSTSRSSGRRTSRKKQRRSQARQDRYLARKQDEQLKRKFRRFLSGSAKFKKKLRPTHEELRDGVKAIDPNEADYFTPANLNMSQSQVNRGAEVEQREMNSLLDLLSHGGAGFMSEKKRSGWVRLLFENFNSISVGTQDWKVDRLNSLLESLDIDVLLGCETNVDWRMIGECQQFLDLLRPGTAKKGVVSHNTTGDTMHRAQRGGTVVSALGRLCDVVSKSGGFGRDPTGLGRYSWIKLGNDEASTVVASAYLPCRPHNSKGETFWDQCRYYHEARGDFRSPDDIMMEDLLREIASWRESGLQVILALDANQHVYTGPLATALKDETYGMTCLFQEATGAEAPNSHFRGSEPITTFFGTGGLTLGDAMAYPHWYGIGDHRVFVLEVSAESLFGGKYPTIGGPASRSLNCKIARVRHNYNKVLKSLVQRHKMHEKLMAIKAFDEDVSPAQYQLMHNKWDNELGDFMASAESQCTKFKSCHIEYSPTVGQWLKRRSILKWILRWHDGKVPDPRNLIRAAGRNGISEPLTTPREEIEARLVAVIGEIFKLKKDAPELRRKHLLDCLRRARERGDYESVDEILRLRRRECERKRQENVNKVTREARGRAIMAIQVDDDGNVVRYDTQEDIVRVINSRIGSRYRLGLRAMEANSQIAKDLGALGDGEAVQKILDGTYVFPPDTDPGLVAILEEAAHIRSEMDQLTTAESDATVEEFISHWRSAREKTSSSDSGRHFGHYIAASDDVELSTLHVESLNIASRRGIPLARWRHSLTILLEKVLGNILVDKLRAICLLEADFNWWLKLIYARRMMSDIRNSNLIPAEQFATTGKTAIDGVMAKQMGFFDRANTLHVTSAVDSVDAFQCYDAVHHAVCSVGLQAHRVPLEYILTYLGTMAEMQFHLRTGFGRDEEGFKGTVGHYFGGLGQGSGGAPSAWQVVSGLMLGAYKRAGYGVEMQMSWSAFCFVVAAVLFVDDCDLLHMCVDPNMSDIEFLARKQRAMYFWAKLLMASGGSLRDIKCSCYILMYKFVNGEARLKKMREMQDFEFVIPVFGDVDQPIEQIEVDTALKTLGVFTAPLSAPKPKSHPDRRSEQLAYMVGKGEKWHVKVSSSKLTTRDIWFSFFQSTKPSMSYGIVPVMDPPEVVEEAFQDLYFKCLPTFGVNRNITKGWRMLPCRFQGLGLPNMALEKLSESLMWLQRHWDVQEGMGLIVREAYERLQVETGLSGNVFLRSFATYGCLATHTWYKVFWEYLDRYNVRLEFGDGYDIPAVRERDQVFMEVALPQTPHSEWPVLNRVRHHKGIFWLSQLTHADGITIKQSCLDRTRNLESTMVFPRQEPTPSNFETWRRVLYTVSSAALRLPVPLGWFRRLPYDKLLWKVSRDRGALVCIELATNSRTLYLPSTNIATRHGRRYVRSARPPPPDSVFPFIVSIMTYPDKSVAVHSVALDPIVSEEDRPTTLLATIRSFPNQSLWRNIDLDGDGEWIVDGLARGSLAIVHDGSFMEHLDQACCSAGGIIFCRTTRRMATYSAAERTDSDTASNYRGELLGGLLAALILKAASALLSGNAHPSVLACDNMGVVIHGNERHRSLKEAQAQADIIRCFRGILASLPFAITYEHVYGHQDDNVPWDSLTLLQQLNTIADQIAKEALWKAFASGHYISSNFPFESFRVIIGGKKVTSSIRSALYKDWGESAARTLFEQRNIVSSSNFDLVCWDAVSAAMDIYPRMFRVWITKMVSHFCGSNRQRTRFLEIDDDSCPCCGMPDESARHVTRCRNDGRSEMFAESASLFTNWLHETHMDADLVYCFSEYLAGRGEASMVEISSSYPRYARVAADIDALGWDSFLEGRIPQSLVNLQQLFLRQCGSYWKIRTWSSHCVQYLLNITHRQWLYRNARIYIKKLDGMTAEEHHTIIDLVQDMMLVDPADLLPCHRTLLQVDFERLGEGSAVDRKLWLTKMHSAIAAAAAPSQCVGPDDDDTASSSAQSAYTRLAFSSYEEYRRHSGIMATKRSNQAKRVRL